MRTLRVFVSSPGDVAEERIIALRVLERLDAEFRGRVGVEAVLWEHEPLVATASFQEQLVKPSDTDIVVSILWSRLGTRLPANVTRPDGSRYESGTQFEFEDAVRAFRERGSPDLLVYRKTTEPVATLLDRRVVMERLDQKEALDRFVAQWFHASEDGSLLTAFHPFATAIEFEQLLEKHLYKLIERKVPHDAPFADAARPEWVGASPFRGLEQFDFSHAANFFGRTQAVSDMIAALKAQADAGRAFLLVLGTSGAGKSSAVRAGLAPMLMQPGVVPGVRTWRRAVFTPADAGGDVFRALAKALLQTDALPDLSAMAGSIDVLARAMRESPAVAADIVARGVAAADTDGPARLLLIFDQLEELFSNPNVNEPDRERAFELMRELSVTGRICIVATLRSDFYQRALQYEALADLKATGGQYDLRPPSPVEISQIVRDPVRRAALRFEVRDATGESLDERLRDAALAEPDVLPLLQFVLEQLFERRARDGTLTFAAYEELGGLDGALARRAEEVLSGLPAEPQRAFPRLLKRLVAVGVGEQDIAVRRRASLEHLEPDVRALAEALVNARLLTAGMSEEGQPTVEIAHEALLLHWPRVAEWVEQNREELRVRARLGAAARRWEQEHRSPDYLLASGKPLYEVKSLLDGDVDLDPLELAFARACDARFRRVRFRRRAAFAGVSALALLTTVSAIVAYDQREEALEESRIADATVSFMVDLFRVADPSENRGNRVTVREILDRGAGTIARSLADQPAVRSSLMASMGEAYGGLGLYEPAIRLLTDALADAEKNASASDLIRTRNALARVLHLNADYDRAAALFRRSRDEAARLYPRGHADLSASLVGLGDALLRLDRTREAEALYREAVAMDRRLHGDLHADTARSLNALGTLLYFDSRYEEAAPLFEEAYRLGREVLGNDHPRVAESLNNLGSLHYQTGNYPEATRIWREALPIFRSVFGAEHPEVASILNNLGRSLLMRGRLAESGELLEEALAMDRKLKSADHDDLVLPLNSLAMVRIGQERLAEAERHIDEAESIARRHKHWLLHQVLMNKADLYVRTGRLEPARSLLAEARRGLEQEYPLAHMPDERWRYAVLDSIEADLTAASGDASNAEAKLVASLPVLRQRFGDEGLYTRGVLQRIVKLYERSGRHDQAAEYRSRLARTAPMT